jgi:hypothetical protein
MVELVMINWSEGTLCYECSKPLKRYSIGGFVHDTFKMYCIDCTIDKIGQHEVANMINKINTLTHTNHIECAFPHLTGS